MNFSFTSELYANINIHVLFSWFIQYHDTHKFVLANADQRDSLDNIYNQLKDEESDQLLCGVIKELISNYNYPNKLRPIIIDIKSDENAYSFDEAKIYLETKFLLFVENSQSDSAFFNSLIRLFKKESESIRFFQLKNKFGYGMGGGSEILKALKTECEGIKMTSFEPKRINRIFVLLDSDRKYPTDSSSKTQVIDFCNENNIPFHVLEKREVENYLPTHLLEKLSSNSNFNYINEILNSLSELHKDYFDLEKGFDNKNIDTNDDPNYVNFYIDLEQNAKGLLRNPNWDRSEHNGLSFKEEFSQYWNDKDLTRESLIERCLHHSDDPEIHPFNKRELPDLVKRISDLL